MFMRMQLHHSRKKSQGMHSACLANLQTRGVSRHGCWDGSFFSSIASPADYSSTLYIFPFIIINIFYIFVVSAAADYLMDRIYGGISYI
jgi:hypothetical protein